MSWFAAQHNGYSKNLRMMANRRQYRYVGPSEIVKHLSAVSRRVLVQSASDVLHWIKDTKQSPEYDNLIVATFVVDTEGRLWINDRRSEHVHCAAGQNVLSAGEMAFALDRNSLALVEVSNQSTGYCPEPESWPVVERALTAASIPHPTDFTMKCIFRLCENCGTKNLIKDEWYVCGVCQSPLSFEWNFGAYGVQNAE
jgi:hypothetical protein